jgi:hypothetical protein
MIAAQAQVQWLLSQDAIAARYEAVSNQPFYHLPSPLPAQRSEQSQQLLQPTQAEVKIEAGEVAAIRQATMAAIAEKGLRSFDTLIAFYSVSSPSAVENFLNSHHQLVALLFSAFPRIKMTWGAEVKPELTLVDDQEGGYPVLMVRLSSNMAGAYEALDRFDDEWWLDHIGEAEGLLNFSLRAR